MTKRELLYLTMGMTTPFPEPESPELERFTVYSRAEIAMLLGQLHDATTYVTAYFDADPGFAVMRMLHVDAEFEEVIFDAPADAELRARLLAAQHVVFVAFLDHVKLQFAARRVAETRHEGGAALRIRLPAELLRLQRRDFYRVQPATTKPAKCLVPYGAKAGAEARRYESLRVIDVSIGGMAVLTCPHEFELPIGRVIEDCFVDLPGVGSFAVSIIVRHVADASEGEVRRCGCEFVDIPPATRVMLQRYINRTEAEKRGPAASPDQSDASGSATATLVR